jgi:hypothetical protein
MASSRCSTFELSGLGYVMILNALSRRIPLERHNLVCTGPLLTLSDFVFYFLAITEHIAIAALDFSMMNEQIFSSIDLSDKTETFVCIETFRNS